MNRENEKLAKILVGAVAGLLFMGLLSLMGGCAAGEVSAAEPGDGYRFTVESNDAKWMYCYVITDTETGVQYLFVRSGNGSGLTVLQPGDTGAEGENHG